MDDKHDYVYERWIDLTGNLSRLSRAEEVHVKFNSIVFRLIICLAWLYGTAILKSNSNAPGGIIRGSVATRVQSGLSFARYPSIDVTNWNWDSQKAGK